MIQRVKNLYSIIANRQLGDDPESVCIRVDIVRELERLTGQNFRSTEDFHRKVNGFLVTQQALRNDAERIASARRQAGLSQKQLADILGVSTQLVKFWETGRRPLNQKAIVWLNSIAQNSAPNILIPNKLGSIVQNSASEGEKSQKVYKNSVPRANGGGA